MIDTAQWFLKLRKFHYGTVEWEDLQEVKFRPPPREEGLAKRDLPRADFCQLQSIGRAFKPHLPCALLFPGVGTQYIGIMKDAMESSAAVRELLDRAQAILGWDVRHLALNGPEENMFRPLFYQPLLFVACMAALTLMQKEHEEEFSRLQCVAGLSLGEYSALVAAGVLDFEEALRLVQLRAEVLDSAMNDPPQSMCSVVGLSREAVEDLCQEALSSDNAENAMCQISSSLFPSGFTVAGTRDTIIKFVELAKQARALQAKEIKGGGGYHTLLMKSAEEVLGKALVEALPRMRPPRCAIYFNRTGRKVSKGTGPRSFVHYLKEQVTHEVLWESTLRNMLSDGVRDFFEVGPMKQVKGMMSRIDKDASLRFVNITV